MRQIVVTLLALVLVACGGGGGGGDGTPHVAPAEVVAAPDGGRSADDPVELGDAGATDDTEKTGPHPHELPPQPDSEPAPCAPSVPGWGAPSRVALGGGCGDVAGVSYIEWVTAPPSDCTCSYSITPGICTLQLGEHAAYIEAIPYADCSGGCPHTATDDPESEPYFSRWAPITHAPIVRENVEYVGGYPTQCLEFDSVQTPQVEGATERMLIRAPELVPATVQASVSAETQPPTLNELDVCEGVAVCGDVVGPLPDVRVCVEAPAGSPLDVACPAPYDVKRVGWSGVGDSRSCSPCDCALDPSPTSEACTVSVITYGMSGCESESSTYTDELDPVKTSEGPAYRVSHGMWWSWPYDPSTYYSIASMSLTAYASGTGAPKTATCTGGEPVGGAVATGAAHVLCCTQ